MTTNTSHSEALEARVKLRRTDPKKAFDDTMAELARTQERLQAVRTRLEKKPAKVTSKDGMITVVLDERGEVTSIAFNTAKFRRMAPAELGAALVEVIGKARAEGRDRVISAYRSFLPEGMDLEKIMSGKLSTDGMLEAAKRRGEQIIAEAQRPIPAATSRPGKDEK
jgi:DNA-binding protein YbaB